MKVGDKIITTATYEEFSLKKGDIGVIESIIKYSFEGFGIIAHFKNGRKQYFYNKNKSNNIKYKLLNDSRKEKLERILK